MRQTVSFFSMVFLLYSIVSAETILIKGKIADSTGAVIKGVIVSLSKYPAIRDTTDSTGSFTLEGQTTFVIRGNRSTNGNPKTTDSKKVFLIKDAKVPFGFCYSVNGVRLENVPSARFSTQLVIVKSDIYATSHPKSSCLTKKTATVDELIFQMPGFAPFRRPLESYYSPDIMQVQSPYLLSSTLAGTWIVYETLITSADINMPPGTVRQSDWTFTVSGQSATLSSSAGSVNGTLVNGIWVFQYEYSFFGVPAKSKIQVIASYPFLKGTEEHAFYDPDGFRPPTTESWIFEGIRQ